LKKPAVPVPYSEETMYGFEYAAAALMIQEGLIEEGLEIVKQGRKRFDGARRNPWNEFECGSNYARSMASYSLLIALSGFEFDANRGMIGFSPVGHHQKFACFWSLDSGWGTVRFTKEAILISVLYGYLRVKEFHSTRLDAATVKRIKIDTDHCEFKQAGRSIIMKETLTLSPSHDLDIRI